MDLRRLLHPRSIAVFGGWQAAAVVRRCDEMGYTGEIWPVHPTKAEVAGRACFRAVADLPGAPDAAFVAVNRELTIEVVRELAASGSGGAVCYASGFKEAGGRGADLQAALVEAAGPMPILGPNCYGIINYVDGALLWFDQHGGRRCERGVALLTQSGNIGLNLTMQRRGLPVAYLMTLGNQARVGLAACVEALVEDPRVTAIGLHIEGLDDVQAFDAAARKALAAGKPIVALRAGRSAAGAALTMSHTASLAGSDAAMQAFLARLGIAQVPSIPVLLETLKLLHACGPLRGRQLVSMSCSGGEASLMADAAEGRRLSFRPFTAEERVSVQSTLSELVTVTNPLDYHTFIWGKREALEATFTAVLACGFDLSLLVLDLPRLDRGDDADWQVTLEAYRAARARTGAAAAVVATLPECLPEEAADRLLGQGIVPLLGMEEALRAAEAAADIGAVHPCAPLLPPVPLLGEPVQLDEWAGKALLARHGVAHPGGVRVRSPAAARDAAERMGFPVVLKAVSASLAHKTEQGAVALGLADAVAVEAAALRMAGLGDGFLVEPMITDGVAELIVGVSRDPQLGLVLVLGAGGILVELLEDRAVLLLPTDRAAVERGLASLRCAPLLRGFRGRPAGDVAAVVDTVLAVAHLAQMHADRLAELDINPLIVCPAGRGAVAADVLIRLVPEG